MMKREEEEARRNSGVEETKEDKLAQSHGRMSVRPSTGASNLKNLLG